MASATVERTVLHLMDVVCFDVEGTLLRTYGPPLERAAFRLATAEIAGIADAAHVKEPQTAADLGNRLATSVAVDWLSAAGIDCGGRTLPRFLAAAARSYKQLSQTGTARPVAAAGARHTLLSMRARGHTVVAVSGLMQVVGRDRLEKADMVELLDGPGFWGCSTSGRKSDLLVLVGQHFGADPKSVWYVGSHPHDEEDARRAHVNFLAVGTGGFQAQDFGQSVTFAECVGAGAALSILP